MKESDRNGRESKEKRDEESIGAEENEKERIREELRRNTTQKGRVTRGSDDVKRADGYSEKGHGEMKRGKENCAGRKREREGSKKRE